MQRFGAGGVGEAAGEGEEIVHPLRLKRWAAAVK
jgi:hypothetical protein